MRNDIFQMVCVVSFSISFSLLFLDCVKCEFIADTYVIGLNEWSEEKWKECMREFLSSLFPSQRGANCKVTWLVKVEKL